MTANHRHGGFPSTHWSEISRAAAEERPGAASLERILVRYSPALRAYLTGAMKLSPPAADDILQGFIADKVLEKDLFSKADKARGRFRSFLVTSLHNYALSVLRRTRKEPFAVADPPAGEHVSDAASPAETFDRVWAMEVIQAALGRMHAHCIETGREDMWEMFRLRVLDPIINGRKAVPYVELVQQLSLRSPMQGFNLLTTAKRAFVRNLRAVIEEYAAPGCDVEEEIRDLRAILSGTGA